MINKDENLRKLWNEFGEILKQRRIQYGFNNVFFEMPESDINSAQDLIAIFETLDNSHMEDVASQYNLTTDEFKELIEQGWKEFKEDNKYPSANDYERYFYQVVDPIIEDIKVAAQNLELETESNFIFGLLPTREINAEAIEAPDNLGYIIGINYGMMFFLDDMGQLFDRFYVKLREQLKNPNVHVESDLVDKYIQESIPESIDERTNFLFVDLIISYFLVGYPGFTFTRPSVQETLYDPSGSGLKDDFFKLVIPFILCHEYAHFCIRAKDVEDYLTEYHQSLTPADREDVADELRRRRNSLSEIMADNIGFQLLIQVAQIYYEMPGPNSNLLVAAVGRAYSGMYSFFCCIEVLERAKSMMEGKNYEEDYDKNDSHLPARIRKEWLGERWINELKDKGYPIFSVTMHGKIFQRFINLLWENNKDKINEVFLNAKQMLD